MRSNYSDPRLHDRLMAVLEQRLGHLVLSEVEKAKIASSNDGGAATIALSAIERGLQASLDADTMAQDLQGLLTQVVDCAAECVRRAGLQAPQLDAMYLTGGSSALRPFLACLRERFPSTAMIEGDLFGGVASGLAYSARRWMTPQTA